MCWGIWRKWNCWCILLDFLINVILTFSSIYNQFFLCVCAGDQVSTHPPCRGRWLARSWLSQQSRRTKLRWTGTATPCWVSDRRSRTSRREGWTPALTRSRYATGLIRLFCMRWKDALRQLIYYTVTIWGQSRVLCFADGSSLSGLHRILHLGQALFQGARCLPFGEWPHLSDFIVLSQLQLVCRMRQESHCLCRPLVVGHQKPQTFIY